MLIQKPKHRKSDLETLSLARDYVKHKARGAIPEYVSGVSKAMVTELYLKEHGIRPPGGPLPSSMNGWLHRNVQYRIPAQKFVNVLYRSTGESMFEDIDPRGFLAAYETYLHLSLPGEPQLDITRAFCLARDLIRGDDVQVRPCSSCGSLHLWTVTSYTSELCWSCENVSHLTGVTPTVTRNTARSTARSATPLKPA